jgi:CDGSH-type Zn-finger protein
VRLEPTERIAGLRLVIGLWRSLAGTALLYSAAAIHLALALAAVHERRTLRMLATAALRIALGFGMPLLLIGHFVATRVGFDLSSDGASRVASGPKTALCRCGYSRNEPFCDGSHVRAGFRDNMDDVDSAPAGRS